MILEVSRSFIKVKLDERIATVKGEMFFSGNDKLGFAVFLAELKHWDAPYDSTAISSQDVSQILDDIRADFAKGGHTLEVE